MDTGKIAVSKIEITDSECASLAGRSFTTWCAVDEACALATREGGADCCKVCFRITWADGRTYDGRHDWMPRDLYAADAGRRGQPRLSLLLTSRVQPGPIRWWSVPPCHALNRRSRRSSGSSPCSAPLGRAARAQGTPGIRIVPSPCAPCALAAFFLHEAGRDFLAGWWRIDGSLRPTPTCGRTPRRS